MLRHADKHIFLLFLGLLGRIEECVEDLFESLDLIYWACLRLCGLFMNLLVGSVALTQVDCAFS